MESHQREPGLVRRVLEGSPEGSFGVAYAK